MRTDFINDLRRKIAIGSTMYVNTSDEAQLLKHVRMACLASVRRNLDGDNPVSEPGRRAAERYGWPDAPKLSDARDRYLELEYLSSRDKLDSAGVLELAELTALFDHCTPRLLTWDMHRGLIDYVTGKPVSVKDPLTSMLALLTAIGVQPNKGDSIPSHCVIVLLDAGHQLDSESHPGFRRALRNIIEYERHVQRGLRRIMLFANSHWTPKPELSRIRQMEFGRCTVPEISALIRQYAGVSNPVPEEQLTDMARACLGLDFGQLTDVVAEARDLFPAFVDKGGQSGSLTRFLQSARAKTLSASIPGLTVYAPDAPQITKLGGIAGCENYLDVVEELRVCLTEEAREQGVEPPRGVVLAGPPGTGKTHMAMLTAKIINLPILHVKAGEAKGQYVGESERNMANIIAVAATFGSDAILFLDEAEKFFAASTEGDSGTSSNMTSSLLQFLSAPGDRPFAILAINRVKGPVELYRTGRISYILSCELPDQSTRAAIIQLKADEAKLKISETTLNLIAGAHTENFSGSDLHELMRRARVKAFRSANKRNHRLLSQTDLIEAAKTILTSKELDPAAVAEQSEIGDKAVSVHKKKSVPTGGHDIRDN